MPLVYSLSLFLSGLDRFDGFGRFDRFEEVGSTSDSVGVLLIGVRLCDELDLGLISGSISGKFDSGLGDDSGVSS